MRASGPRTQVFISYAHEDEPEALYVRSIIDGSQWTKEGRGIVGSMKDNASQVMQGDSTPARWKAAGRLAALAALAVSVGVQAGRQYTIQAQAWIDKDIPVGTDWNEEIKKAITQSQVVVVLAPNFLAGYVALECGIALGKQKAVVPIARSIGDLQSYNLQQYQALPWPAHSPDWENTFRQALGRLI